MTKNYNLKLDSKIFENTDSEFIKNISKIKNKINEKNQLLQEKKDELSNFFTNKHNVNIENFNTVREYIDTTSSLLDSLYIQINNYNTLFDIMNNIEINLIKLIEELNFDNFKDDLSAEYLNNQIVVFKNLYENDEKLFNDFIKEYNSIVANYKNVSNISSRKKSYNKSTLSELTDNNVLLISEVDNKILLPYTIQEINNLLDTYPDVYKTPADVIEQEFTLSYNFCKKNPIITRFREAYYLYRNKEMRSVWESFIFAKSLMFMSNYAPAVVAAVKSEKQLNSYLECLDNNRVDTDFKYFKIEFKVRPATT